MRTCLCYENRKQVLSSHVCDCGRSRSRRLSSKPLDTRAGPFCGSSGYTLTELMMVLGILGVVLGLSGIWLSSQMPYYRLNGVVRQIRADLLSARAQAARRGNPVRVSFTDPQHYDIWVDHNQNRRADPDEIIEARSIQEDFPGVAIEFNRNRDLIFKPRGTASNLGTIKVSNASGEKAITIAITGRVKVDDPRA